MGDPFTSIGIHVQDVISGFIGGVGRVLMPPYISAWNALATILLGAMTAAYLTDFSASLLAVVLRTDPDKLSRGAVGFIVGMTAMTICQGIIGAVNKMRFGGRKNAP